MKAEKALREVGSKRILWICSLAMLYITKQAKQRDFLPHLTKKGKGSKERLDYNCKQN